jgi:8-hydroxy-5-deazaflavin:NADPH oxidoreductase
VKSIPIAILGAGSFDAALARRGHSIAFGVQDPVSEKVTAAIAALKGKGRAAHNEEAVQLATVVALCVPWPAAEQAIRTSGNLTGKIVIDCTNPGITGSKGVGNRHRNVRCRVAGCRGW